MGRGKGGFNNSKLDNNNLNYYVSGISDFMEYSS